MKKEGVLVDAETLNRLSPYITQHINRYGKYWLDLNRQSPPINYQLSILSYWEKAGCPLGRIKIRLITGSRIRILADFVRIVLGVRGEGLSGSIAAVSLGRSVGAVETAANTSPAAAGSLSAHPATVLIIRSMRSSRESGACGCAPASCVTTIRVQPSSGVGRRAD